MIRRAANYLNHLLGRIGDRHAGVVGLGVVAAAGFMVWVVVQSTTKVPFSDPFQAKAVVPAHAPILRPGDHVRFAGRRVGKVRDIKAVPAGRLVEFDIEDGELGRDAAATVRQRGFSGSVYLDVRVGDLASPMPEGGTIPRSRTDTTQDLATVVSAFDDDARQALGRTASEFGGGLAGRRDDVKALVRDLPAMTRDVQPVMRGLAANGELSGMLAQLRRTAHAFAAPGSSDLGPMVTAADRSFGVLANERGALRDLVEELPAFEDRALRTLPVADPLLRETEALARRFTGATSRLQATLPHLNALLRRRDDLDELTELAEALDPVVVRGRPLLDELTPVGASLTPLTRPFVPFAEYLHPYREDIVWGMDTFRQYTEHRYAEGMASGEGAVRFNAIFTCARSRNNYPRPGQSRLDRAKDLEEACR